MVSSTETKGRLYLPLVIEELGDLFDCLPDSNETGEKVPEGELVRVAEERFIFEALFHFRRFVDRAVSEELVGVPFSFNFINFPRRVVGVGDVGADGELRWECPVALPFLEAMYSVTTGAFHAYWQARQKDGYVDNRTIICRQACLALSHLLLSVEKIKAGKENLGLPVWEAVTDGYRIFSATAYHESEVVGVYFTPERNRFGIRRVYTNPRGRKPDLWPTQAEFRFDIDHTDIRRSELQMDVSVREWSEKNFRGQRMTWFSPKAGIEQLDVVFGENRHHFPIGKGFTQGCVDYVAAFMNWCGLGHMFKSTSDLPPRVKKT